MLLPLTRPRHWTSMLPTGPFLAFLLAVAHLLMAATAAMHALLYKRDPRAALGWVAVSLLVPFLGPMAYYTFGINRVRSKARLLGGRRLAVGYEHADSRRVAEPDRVVLPPDSERFRRISDVVSGRPLTPGNRVEPLVEAEEAYPAMLAAIRDARHSVYLSTYIFDTDAAGMQFVEAMDAARRRGVDVRVIVDGIGERYSRLTASRLLRRYGIACERFLPPRLLPPVLNINLRNHRKLLLVDNAVAFAGGMNISARHLSVERPNRVRDLHFRVTGPLVAQLQRVFVGDWLFSGGRPFAPETPDQVPAAAGDTVCRLISDGPDEDLDRLALTIEAAVGAASRRVRIMTPYFLPGRELVGALKSAAIRGVQVQVILPAHNNLRYVHWATRNLLWELLDWGVEVYYQPGPFVHSKLFAVDDGYAHVTTANMDPRSLRLNFELAIEVFDPRFAAWVDERFQLALRDARAVTRDEIEQRPLASRTRDALCWLFSPYL